MRRVPVTLVGALIGAAGCLGDGDLPGPQPVRGPGSVSQPALVHPHPGLSPSPGVAAVRPPVSPVPPLAAASAAAREPTGVGTLPAEPDWSRTPVGGEPADFLDPAAAPGTHPYWLATGRWAIVKVETLAYQGLAYQPSHEQPQPWLSFRVLDRVELPRRYRVTATVQPVSSPVFKAPVGEISIIPYYRDPTHYMEVLVTNERLEIWQADGAEPDTDRGWTGVHFLPLRTRIGELRTVAIDMDLDERRLTASAGDQTYRLQHAFLDPGPRHRVAVRSAGNTFNLVRFRVEPLSSP